MTENQWKSLLRKAFEEFGGTALSLHGHGMQAPGWPDLYVAHKIWSGWFELKANDGALSTAQKIIGRRLERHGLFYVLRLDGEWCHIESTDGHRMPLPVSCMSAKEILDAISL